MACALCICFRAVGVGYQMAIVKKSTCDTPTVTSVIQSNVAGARLSSDISAELSYILPQDSKADFSRLFTQLDRQSEDLGIVSYGVSVTTMDEVFIRLLYCWCDVKVKEVKVL